LVWVMVSAMMLAAPGSSVTGMKGLEEVPEAEGVTADEGVTASSEGGAFSNTHTMTGQCGVRIVSITLSSDSRIYCSSAERTQVISGSQQL